MRTGAVLLTALALLTATSAMADGVAAFDPKIVLGDAGTSDQRAVVIHDGNTECLILETKVRDRGKGYAWVIPTPSRTSTETIVEVDAALFDVLHTATAPRIEYIHPKTKGWGTKAEEPPGAWSARPPVRVWETARIGDYDVTVLTAEESKALADWLAEHGYELPGKPEPVLASYVERGWAFTAVRVAPGSRQDLASLKPLALTFASAEPVYPLMISQLSAVPGVTEILVYVIADSTVRTAPYDTVTVDTSGLEFYQLPLEVYEKRLRDASRPTSDFIVEYAGGVPEEVREKLAPVTELVSLPEHPTLSRFRAKFTGEQMLHDVTFTSPGIVESPFGVVITGYEPGTEAFYEAEATAWNLYAAQWAAGVGAACALAGLLIGYRWGKRKATGAPAA